MKNYLLFVLLVLVGLGCGKEKTISDELVGDWFYERETHISFSSFDDPDTEGFMSFNDDETGYWESSNGFQSFDLEWDLQMNDSKISITKYFVDQTALFPSNTIFDLTRENEDEFRLTFHLKFESPIDSIETLEQFENIILTRME
ncbi:MAG: hypothetical protein AAGA77_03315 [Bacteroidota bacterium]